jgi:UDP-N-acetylmuramate dehydrogenase
MSIERVIANLKGVVVKKNVDLSQISFSRTGGMVKYYFLPLSESSAINLFAAFYNKSEDYKVIGKTSNIIFLDVVEYSYFIDLKNLSSFNFTGNNSIYIQSGREVSDICRDVAAKCLSGLEGLEGVPGTLGGAITMNAGAYGYKISDHIVSVRVYSKESNQVQTLSSDKCLFDHRRSLFSSGKYIILGANFSLLSSSIKKIQVSMSLYHIARHTYQDYTLPNLGSIFYFHEKNIYELIYENTSGYKRAVFYFLKRLWTSRLTRHVRRAYPDNKILNYFILNYLKFKIDTRLISDKTLNTFVNPGVTTLEICKHIQSLKFYLAGSIKLENEIFVGQIYSIIDVKAYMKILNIKEDVE